MSSTAKSNNKSKGKTNNKGRDNKSVQELLDDRISNDLNADELSNKNLESTSNQTESKITLDPNELDEFDIDLDEEEGGQINNQSAYFQVANLDLLHDNNMTKTIEGRLLYAYKLESKIGTKVSTKSNLYHTYPIIICDMNDRSKQIKITIWDSLAIEFDNNNSYKCYDHIRFINLKLKKVGTEMNNWGTVKYVGNTSNETRIEKINTWYDLNLLTYKSLNQLEQNTVLDTRGIVNIVDLISKKIQIKSKLGSVWIKFWTKEKLVDNIQRNTLLVFVGFYCKQVSVDLNGNPVLELNDTKFSFIKPIERN